MTKQMQREFKSRIWVLGDQNEKLSNENGKLRALLGRNKDKGECRRGN